jgi:glycosyltransferase involved in cell wall biosynthesis
MRITSFIHPVRTFLPCSGVGRHMNHVLLQLHGKQDVALRLLFARQWLTESGRLPVNCPLCELPFDTFPWPENLTERGWKLTGYPYMDSFVSPETDWIYCPMDTLFPTRRKIPTAITLHDIHPFEPELPWRSSRDHAWQRWKWGRWVGRAIAMCTVVFTVSEFSKRRMVELLNAPESKIVVVGNGVDNAFFAAADASGSDFRRIVPQPYLLTIGGLRAPKGGRQLLDVAHELARRASDIQLVVAGPNDPGLEREALTMPNVHLLGMVADDQLPGLLKQSLALLFLSLYEGFGIPPLEAMAVGTPAIVSNRASLPEVVGDAGIVVDPDEPAAIADICTSLCANESLRTAYVTKGRSHAAQRTWDRTADIVFTALHDFAP